MRNLSEIVQSGIAYVKRRSARSQSRTTSQSSANVRSGTSPAKQGPKSQESVPPAAAFPQCPPPSPAAVPHDRNSYALIVRARKYGAPQGEMEDRPLYALYRIYEHVILDNVIAMRNELEAFWWKKWAVDDIPDPQDEDEPERYAVLACIPALLAEAFNQRIDLGLRRDAPGIMNPDEAARYAATPKVYEKAPDWTSHVKPLNDRLDIPHVMKGHTQLTTLDDERASPPFKEKNILIWHPHIHFV